MNLNLAIIDYYDDTDVLPSSSSMSMSLKPRYWYYCQQHNELQLLAIDHACGGHGHLPSYEVQWSYVYSCAAPYNEYLYFFGQARHPTMVLKPDGEHNVVSVNIITKSWQSFRVPWTQLDVFDTSLTIPNYGILLYCAQPKAGHDGKMAEFTVVYQPSTNQYLALNGNIHLMVSYICTIKLSKTKVLIVVEWFGMVTHSLYPNHHQRFVIHHLICYHQS
jgi:hypothetical protein